MKDGDFKRLADRVAAAWRVTLTKDTIGEWWRNFEDLPYAESEEALNRMIRTTDRMPGNILPMWLEGTRAVMKEHGFFGRPEPEQQTIPTGTADPRRPYNKAWRHLVRVWQQLSARRANGWTGMEPHERKDAEARFQMVVMEIDQLKKRAAEKMPPATEDDPDPVAPPELVAAAVAAEQRVYELVIEHPMPGPAGARTEAGT